jgi:hypothetical protein
VPPLHRTQDEHTFYPEGNQKPREGEAPPQCS